MSGGGGGGGEGGERASLECLRPGCKSWHTLLSLSGSLKFSSGVPFGIPVALLSSGCEDCTSFSKRAKLSFSAAKFWRGEANSSWEVG